MTPEQAAWVCAHVLAPRQIPAQPEQCPCQITSSCCRRGEHHRCGHEQWQAWGGFDPETVIGRGWGPFPASGRINGGFSLPRVYLADRECRTYCNCFCHRPPPEGRPVPAGEQLDLFALT
ncbi:hypothetical protein [Streptacidiphilus sp. EB103A]|uniref:hypothetical protein n=1 Tax=Streptacidiphilus sp. EB103A TaxID=3156275 RepID=UPI0035186EE2